MEELPKPTYTKTEIFTHEPPKLVFYGVDLGRATNRDNTLPSHPVQINLGYNVEINLKREHARKLYDELKRADEYYKLI